MFNLNHNCSYFVSRHSFQSWNANWNCSIFIVTILVQIHFSSNISMVHTHTLINALLYLVSLTFQNMQVAPFFKVYCVASHTGQKMCTMLLSMNHMNFHLLCNCWSTLRHYFIHYVPSFAISIHEVRIKFCPCFDSAKIRRTFS